MTARNSKYPLCNLPPGGPLVYVCQDCDCKRQRLVAVCAQCSGAAPNTYAAALWLLEEIAARLSPVWGCDVGEVDWDAIVEFGSWLRRQARDSSGENETRYIPNPFNTDEHEEYNEYMQQA